MFAMRPVEATEGQSSRGPASAFSASKMKWRDIDPDGESEAVEVAKLRGLPHQRSMQDRLSMQCDEVQVDEDVVEALMELPHEKSTDG